MRNVLFILIICLIGVANLPAEEIRHEVQRGETLYGIARTYGITTEELTRINGIESPDLLLPGTILSVGREYRVQQGDTLFGIARAHGTSVSILQDLNRLESSVIIPGQQLRLPLESRQSIAHLDSGKPADAKEEGTDPRSEQESPARRAGGDSIPVALSLESPIPFAEGGAWPVAGTRLRLEGKLPGVLIRADRGTSVSAVASGRVVYAGPHSTFGNVVFVQSAQGFIYVYGGQEQVLVRVGETVAAGATLGTVGTNPGETGTGLFFSVWRNNTFVDPETAPRG